MIDLVLAERSNYELVEIEDLGDGPRWREMIVDRFGPLCAFATANQYVRSLLEEDYEVIHPVTLIPQERRVPVDGTMVRVAMARGENWAPLVPPVIVSFLRERGLVERFRREFGLETLALAVSTPGAGPTV